MKKGILLLIAGVVIHQVLVKDATNNVLEVIEKQFKDQLKR